MPTHVLAPELHYIPGHGQRTVTLSDFEIGKKLGEGRFGSVFSARDKTSNAIVALKRLDLQLIIKERMEKQVKRELDIMQKLKHKNILRLFTYFVDQSYIWLVLEYAARGDTWNRLLAEKRFDLPTTAKLVSQLTEAVDCAHRHHVIHRDIKPENLLLDANKNLKLADFGWSVLDRHPKRRTYCGTPDYLPPEMAANKSYDSRVDNWCIGVFAYECMFGKPPFEAPDDVTRAKKILEQKYTFPSTPTLPECCYDFIRQLLVVDPSKRMSVDQILDHPFISEYYPQGKAERERYNVSCP
eukprot:TRINITY_DN34855_c0_g1_i1.p1 TRINITY_DN34855_c0_g1~~TRINITY_DN34855_c0_g1_i1.p1  ORF type:complete len:333 (+),score=60.01 TRINITY_DN34855_c0_g1_i1:107-1000(+)